LSDEVIKRIYDRAAHTQEPVDALTYSQLRMIDASPTELSTVLEEVYKDLQAVPMTEDRNVRPFVNCGIHLVHRAHTLVTRMNLCNVLLRVQHDATLGSGSIAHIKKAHGAGERVFQSGAGLTSGGMLVDAYLGPLLGAVSPAVWSFAAFHAFGGVIATLGQPLAGTRGEAAELLQVLPQSGPTERVKIPQLGPSSSSAAITWWTYHLNKLFGVITDPAVFSDTKGVYCAVKQFHGIATVEQLFRRVATIQTTYRDRHARQVLLFTVLDTLERVTGWNLEELCLLSRARATLEKLRREIPPDAAEVLLPGAERAVMALQQVQGGFFMSRQFNAKTIEILNSGGQASFLSLENAAARYIKVLRNATHGHGSGRAGVIEEKNALLAHHDGRLPHDLSLLGYLYLLDVLVNPDRLRLKLYRSGRI
jgi:hypothetical protein